MAKTRALTVCMTGWRWTLTRSSRTLRKYVCASHIFRSTFNFINNYVGCSPGHAWNSATSRCRSCPLNTYTDNDYADSCTPCPAGQISTQVGSVMCRPGTFSSYLSHFKYFTFANLTKDLWKSRQVKSINVDLIIISRIVYIQWTITQIQRS